MIDSDFWKTGLFLNVGFIVLLKISSWHINELYTNSNAR